MDIGPIVYERLTGYAAVAALVGTRVSAIEASDKEALPLIIYQVTLNEGVDGTAPVAAASATRA